MTKLIKCKVCDFEFMPTVDRHYISREPGKTGLDALHGGFEPKIYDTFDCPQCGCQVIVAERKRATGNNGGGKNSGK